MDNILVVWYSIFVDPGSLVYAGMGLGNDNVHNSNINIRTSGTTVLNRAPFPLNVESSDDQQTVILDGTSLTCEGIAAFVRSPDAVVAVAPQAAEKIHSSHALVLANMTERPVYGVNTGFGPMVTQIISTEKLIDLQYNLIRGHAVGAGEPIKSDYVLAAMLVRLNTLVKGRSGVSMELVEVLTAMINNRITPVVPEHGGVGASGDLIQLAHIALSVIGEGEVIYKGERRPTADVFVECTITPHTLRPKEGLSLINGTSVMTGIAALLVCDAQRTLDIAVRAGALAFELVHGFTDVISEDLHAVRSHEGQAYIAARMRELTHDSKLVTKRQSVKDKIQLNAETHATSIQLQEVYSIRCIPQILGPIHETIQRVEKIVDTEINSVTDNPIVDATCTDFLHGGNFHGDYVSGAVDQMKAAIVKLTMLSERRINFFLNKNVNKTFSPFLNLVEPGLTMGLQGLQFTATSTTACSQSLAFPHSVHSISTNGDNQDIVSMGTDGALMTGKVLDNAHIVEAIEMITVSQAVEALGVESQLSTPSRELFKKVRAYVPAVYNDRSLTHDIASIVYLLKSSDEFYYLV